MQHEASVSQVSEEMLFYMQQRGIPKAAAMSLAVNGFINDLVRNSPWNTLWSCAGSLIWKWKTASDKEGNNEPFV